MPAATRLSHSAWILVVDDIGAGKPVERHSAVPSKYDPPGAGALRAREIATRSTMLRRNGSPGSESMVMNCDGIR